jgi:nucleoside-diphosphate-sugar epimerase
VSDRDAAQPVVVTGANGFVGARACAALVERGVTVRAVVRRAGTAPEGHGIEEHVGDFAAPDFAAAVLQGASAAVTTVYPMSSQDSATERRAAVEGTKAFARAAVHAGVEWLVHVSTAAVYDRARGIGDVDESATLVGDDANDYAATKRDTDLALHRVDGITRVLVRPPAILGAGDTSIWNTVRPSAMRDDVSARSAVADQSFAWVHVEDLVTLIADLAAGRVAVSNDPDAGPVSGACTPVNVAADPATARDYYLTVTSALGVAPVWVEAPAWTGRILSGRARRWGWSPTISLSQALVELETGLS